MTDKPWPASKIVQKRVSDLVPYARNARTHSDHQVGQIAASIREWGWTVPILVDEENEIIAGHGRILAAEMLGIDKVPAMVAKGWTKAQKRAYCLADNKLALNAGWDEELLPVELEELKGLEFDLDLTGFSDDEITLLLDDGAGFGAGDESDQGDLGSTEPKTVTCPHCGEEFDPDAES